MEYLQNLAIEKLQQLVPNKRFKRGLLDPLGSLIKVITGNLDHADAINYDNLIFNLQSHEQALSQKITLISDMLDHFMNSTETLNRNTKIIDTRLKHIENLLKEVRLKENNTMFSTTVLGLYNLFIINFRTIYLKLSEIETALAFSKVSVLHKSIINSTELLLLLKSIDKYDNLMYPVTESNLINLEEVITLKAYIKQTQIVFILEVPLTDNNTYVYYKLYPLPMSFGNQTRIVIPKYPYLLVKSFTYVPIHRPCKDIAANQYMCTEQERVLYPDATCMQQLMQYADPSHCIQYPVEIEDIKLQRISSHSWILFSQKTEILSRRCGTEITQLPIRGTYILSINDSCEATIDKFHIHLQNSHAGMMQYQPIPIINLQPLHPANETDVEPINLQNVNLDDMKYLNFLLKKSVSESAKSPNKTSGVKINSVSLATLLLYVLASIVTVFLVYRHFNVIQLFFTRKQPAPVNPEPGVSALKGGGVISRDTLLV